MSDRGQITVFYDGSCSGCVRDRYYYESLQAEDDQSVIWFDITNQETQLRAWGIDPRKALLELHVRDANGNIRSELDAYRLLMSRVPRLKWLGWLLGLPLIRPVCSQLYHVWVERRLRREGRL
ncbi:DCC1-like thiol-disulfide oxidoreductase family protein [uncultured Amphritea sp.]|uniref:DCC1-like thiol-disulfide oxidoreductase family protein n=1 Tax=Amphritea sp. TaxID=1872502 RepID=UPI0025D4B01C|nr:DCC1-like thiol-disulfide oxidoreductase family protein [uncultured Amphritea sp.]